jgi:hypothetical protein
MEEAAIGDPLVFGRDGKIMRSVLMGVLVIGGSSVET